MRAMQYVAESEYWVSPDMTLYHPELFARNGGVRRMVRLKNPHQICVCVMGNGVLALLHQDSYANISAWSRLWISGNMIDACVLPQDDGTDVLYMLVRRKVEGVTKVYLEAIGDWTYAEESNWGYTASSVTYIPATAGNVITGLDHLEGKIVQVVADRSYIGSWQVEGGQITMLDGTGAPINVSNAEVGVSTRARIRTMPQITQDPGSKKRWSDLYVRVVNSSRPKINGKRPRDRDPIMFMDEAQQLDVINDYQDVTFNHGRTKIIEVRETLPTRLEILGIFGTVESSSV